ncbi:hypothetical protein GCM10009624_15250 [Gordonia sinesedis]
MHVVRSVAVADTGQAIDLVASAIPDIPAYAWVLGPELDDPSWRSWIATLLTEPMVANSRVVGAFDGGRLVGLVGYRDPDDPQSALDADQKDAHIARAMTNPDLARRLVAVLTRIAEAEADGEDAVGVSVAAVSPQARRGGVLWDLMATVEEHCRAHNRRYRAWTGHPELRTGWMRTFDLKPFATIELGDIELYGLQSDRPPRRRDGA